MRCLSTSVRLSQQEQKQESPIESSFHPATQQALQSMNIQKLFEVQSKTFNKTMEGQDLIVQAPTGSGKTLSFVLPLMEKLIKRAERGNYRSDIFEGSRGVSRPLCLIVAPTRELANQINSVILDYIQAARKYLPKEMKNIQSVCAYGGANRNSQASALCRSNSDIVVGTPGRLKDFLQDGIISLDELEILILDEVDRMLDVGFAPDIEMILGYSKGFRNRMKSNDHSKGQVLLYSATVPSWVKQNAKSFLNPNHQHLKLIDESQEIAGRNENVFHYAVKVNSVTDLKNVSEIINYLVEQICGEKQKAGLLEGREVITRSLIFGPTKLACDRMSNFIHNSATLHGDVSQHIRESVYEGFKRGRITTVVATDVASRGLDIPNIDLVVQLEPPKTSDIETYVHRSGRTGRAGMKGISIILYDDMQDAVIGAIERKTGISFSEFVLPEGLDKTELRNNNNFRNQRGGGAGYGRGGGYGRGSSRGSRGPRYDDRRGDRYGGRYNDYQPDDEFNRGYNDRYGNRGRSSSRMYDADDDW